MTVRLPRQQLSPADRELFDLNYLDATEHDSFARNLITDPAVDAGRSIAENPPRVDELIMKNENGCVQERTYKGKPHPTKGQRQRTNQPS
jgi:hypothetical protein